MGLLNSQRWYVGEPGEDGQLISQWRKAMQATSLPALYHSHPNQRPLNGGYTDVNGGWIANAHRRVAVSLHYVDYAVF